MHTIKYRMTGENLRPRRTKLEIPGWAGQPEPRVDGSHEYAWHCVPFSEAAHYGVEVFYPYANELRVTTTDGRLVFDGNFGPPPDEERNWPPFRTFGEQFYTYQILLDLKVEAGFALKIEPHPRFYTDPTDSVPIAVPALIRNWWPMLFFVVFKSPPEGRAHVFRPGEPFAQFTIIPEECDFELVEMSEEEAAERELQSRRIYESRATLGADSQWVSASNTVFDATYRRIHGAARKLPPR
ncbi:MAG TPA: hypothetical protein VIE47_01375 [Methylocystis sp.]